MTKMAAMLGILLIATMLIISGSAVATWVYVTVDSSNNCTSISNIEAAEDDTYASLGQDGFPPVLGWVLLDLGSINAMPADQDFTVFADTNVEEHYIVYVGETSDIEYALYVGSGNDTTDFIFTTPASPQAAWYRYIYLEGTSGVQAGGDYGFGPDIDAVGWDKP